MNSNRGDFGRALVVKSDDERQGGGDQPGRAGPADRPSSAPETLLPQHPTGYPGSKVTWQGFVDWMTARGA